MAKSILSLQASEGIVIQAAAVIYAAYVRSGRVSEGDEKQWMKRSIQEAFWIAQKTDEAVQSDHELA